MATLEKAKLTVLEGSKKNHSLEVLFNPSEYSLDSSNTYKASPMPGLSSPLLQFVNGEARQLSLELFLDDYTDPASAQSDTNQKSVKERMDELSNLMKIDAEIHAPPPIQFSWGTLIFKGILEKMGRKISLFQPNGTPARARVTLTFKEYRTLAEQLNSPSNESSDKSKRRVVIGSDSLWLLAQREYGDVRQWKLIAQANDLDDPLAIHPGQWLILPPLEK